MAKATDVEYLQRILQMNPLEQAGEILALRSDFLQPASALEPKFNADTTVVERRRVVAERLDALREEFWSCEADLLHNELKQLDVIGFPDLAVAVARMKAAAARLPAFRRLREHPHCFPEFYDSFCRLVIESPRKAAEMRAAELKVARQGISFPHYRSAREYRRVARVVDREFPELYALEEEWIRQILAERSWFRWPAYRTTTGPLETFMGTVLVLALLYLVIHLLVRGVIEGWL